jgi:alpha-tubulin suppressor-like RCC1 family protein
MIRINRSSPVQVGSLTDWKEISATGGYHSLALKTNGTLWSWGFNAEDN